MKAVTRFLAVWTLTLSQLAALSLPMNPLHAVDADGICESRLTSAAQSVEHFDAGQPEPARSHCLFCHLRHDMAGAFVSAVAQVLLPADDVRIVSDGSSQHVNLAVVGQAPPRGPPVVS